MCVYIYIYITHLFVFAMSLYNTVLRPFPGFLLYTVVLLKSCTGYVCCEKMPRICLICFRPGMFQAFYSTLYKMLIFICFVDVFRGVGEVWGTCWVGCWGMFGSMFGVIWEAFWKVLI